ncbi:ABC transporter permease [Ignavigranum ruoffiae]|uniref:Osmoprotectant transport system permease protein n=1 Tax=Ignavigranum ruoffiae TaxID=89093 RepID=A0A1H9F1B8_9LACT|nr:ABC transporter permease [Ignavigranum ruoffiae]UPQ86015.1 ABC transporter permease [Ignavigranum ruoffiae]SEQ31659.1 osmoprotectant transport system permease protein [Ignavigranum ruoffiae]
MSFLQEYGGELLINTGEHLYIAFVALLLGVLVAVPLGILLTKVPKVAKFVIGLASIFQTIPSLALLAFMIPLFGIGKVPAILAMFIYSLLPILRNTYVGMDQVDENLKDAAKGMGMTSWESIRKVEIPMAMPVIMAGIRLSAVYVVAWTTLASYIGAGGLGDFIFNGLQLYKIDLILAGTIPITILALLTDLLLAKLEKYLEPQIRRQEEVSEE